MSIGLLGAWRPGTCSLLKASEVSKPKVSVLLPCGLARFFRRMGLGLLGALLIGLSGADSRLIRRMCFVKYACLQRHTGHFPSSNCLTKKIYNHSNVQELWAGSDSQKRKA